MKKTSLIILILISFFFTSEVKAEVTAGSTSGRTITYKIDSVSIESQYTTVKGYAYLDRHNNYHASSGPSLTKLEIKAIGSNGNTIATTSISYNDSMSNYNATKDGICWKMYCGVDAYGNNIYTDRNGNKLYNQQGPPHYNTADSQCFYDNVNFIAQFSTTQLSGAGTVKFEITVHYNTTTETVWTCADQREGKNKNSNIHATMGTPSSFNAYQKQEVKQVSSCNVDGVTCGGEQQINGKKVKVTQGSTFSIEFEGGETGDPDTADGEITPGSSANRELIYKISNFEMEEDFTTVKGYAYIDKHNNYHIANAGDGRIGLTYMKIFAVSSGTNISPESITFSDGEDFDVSIPDYSFTEDKVCWKPNCARNGEYYYWLDENEKYFEPELNDCMYEHVFFEAKFNTRKLRNQGKVRFKIEIDYNLAEETRICEEYMDGELTNEYITDNITYWWGIGEHGATETAEIKEVSGCKIDNDSCAGEHELVFGQVLTSKVNVTNNGSIFEVAFDNGNSRPGSIFDFNDDQNLNLMCENGYYNSGKLKIVEKTYTASYGDVGCIQTGSATVTANYAVIETGALEFTLDRGPIFAGGAFEFKVDYRNAAKWYFVDDVPDCPVITIDNVYATTQGCEEGDEDCEGETVCSGQIQLFSPDCPDPRIDPNASRENFQAQIAADNFRDISTNVSINNLPGSNSVSDSYNSNVGGWECSITGSTNDWEPNTDLVTDCTYRLKTSHLNRQTADVSYSDSGCSNNEICKENLYYTPLKWTDTTIPIELRFGYHGGVLGLSTIADIDWKAEYQCDVDVVQLLYDRDGKGYQFFYRPIDLNNPFPNRQPSANWLSWWNTPGNREQLADGYSNKEYRGEFTPQDINRIKQYNDTKLNGGNRLGYLDYSINANGTSQFINNNPNYFMRSTNDYARLGERN